MWKSRDEFYHSREWKRKAEQIKNRDHNICQHCNNRRVVEAYKRGDKYVKMIVHHKVWLNDKNFNDRKIALGDDNLETVCIFCHNEIHGDGTGTVPGVRFDNNGNLIKDTEGGDKTPPGAFCEQRRRSFEKK